VQDKPIIVVLLLVVLTTLAPSSSVAAKIAALEDSQADESSNPGLAQGATMGSSWTIAKAVLPVYTIRRTVPEVRIHFTVADSRDRLLQSLSKEDFRVLDNRLSVQRIFSFSRQENLPLQVSMLLDVSDSVEQARGRDRMAAQYFFANILRPQTDRVTLLAFSNDVRVWQPSTSSREELSGALTKIRQQGYATYLYDSVFRACLDQFPVSHDGDTGQRILVVISDGMDTGSLHSLPEAISVALRREVQIFAVSVHVPRHDSSGDATLQRLSESTGGKLYVVNSEKDFPTIFSAMAQLMRTQYVLSYQPTEQTPGFHTVKIEAAGSETLRIRARAGYFFEGPQN
jgi:Ca-activated chloride channel family protein